jgi:hypothetical protein
LYGFETWSLALKEIHRLRVCNNRVLRRIRRIFGRQGEEMMWGWRKLYNEELRNLYPSPNIIRVIKLRRMRHLHHRVQNVSGDHPASYPRDTRGSFPVGKTVGE